MNRAWLFAGIALALLSNPALAQPAEGIDPRTGGVRLFSFGDPAPRLKPDRWLKGEEVKTFEPGTVYVVWFFSSWSMKSLQAAPMFVALHERFNVSGVRVLGVSVWESTKPAEPGSTLDTRLETFLKEHEPKFPYAVAYDGGDGEMAQTWMRGSDRRGLPAAFVIDKAGQVAWLGHPSATEEPLATIVEGVLAGTFNAREAGERAKVQAELVERARKLDRTYLRAMSAKDGKHAITLLDEMMILRPGEFTDRILDVWRITAIENEDPAAAYAWLRRIADGDLAKNGLVQNNIAWDIATAEGLKERDLELALKLAARAVAVTESNNAYILDTLARVHFELDDFAKAVEVQERAVAGAEDSDRRATYVMALEKYKAASKGAE